MQLPAIVRLILLPVALLTQSFRLYAEAAHGNAEPSLMIAIVVGATVLFVTQRRQIVAAPARRPC